MVNLAVRADIPMQLISVRDIGAFAAIAFDRPEHFLGRTVELAGDVLTPPQIAETFGRACGLPARFRQTPIEQVRAFDEQLAQMFTFFNDHPADPTDVRAAGGTPRPDAAGDLAAHDRLETLSTESGQLCTDGLLVPPGGGRRIQTMTLKAGAEQSKVWSTFEAEVPPGFDVGAHLHHRAEEVFYVLEGELDLLAFQPTAHANGDWRTWESETGATVFRGGPGSFMLRARRVPACVLQPGIRTGPDALPRVAVGGRDLPTGTHRPAGDRGTTGPGRNRGTAAPPRHPGQVTPLMNRPPGE